ncbi:hypothetical protein ANRL2_02775 [Anaerolineae bacterium]|nr:hypothetical protein ANRL2_02775 [Anaerolineae bacterium]
MRIRVALSLIIAIMIFAGAGFATYRAQAQPSREDDVAVTYVGTIEGEPDVFVGVGLVGDEATVYICDGQADKNTVSVAEWFIGPVLNGQVEVLNESGNRAQVTLNETTGSGQFTFVDGTVKTFTLELVQIEGAGLFRSEFGFGENLFVGGWIILSDGSVRGAVLQRPTVTTPAILEPANFLVFSSAIYMKVDG